LFVRRLLRASGLDADGRQGTAVSGGSCGIRRQRVVFRVVKADADEIELRLKYND
jgi:hypothetical protein